MQIILSKLSFYGELFRAKVLLLSKLYVLFFNLALAEWIFMLHWDDVKSDDSDEAEKYSWLEIVYKSKRMMGKSIKIIQPDNLITTC